jgi:ABC-2 type transport system ATP-binding protein
VSSHESKGFIHLFLKDMSLAMRGAEIVLESQGLEKRFDGLRAVDGVSLRVERGEILGLLGPNGAGKTTTIQLLLGLTTPTRGRIFLFGRELKRNMRAILGRVNFSSAYTALPTNLTVRENLDVFSRLYGIAHPRSKIRELLELFELGSTENTVSGALSSGQLTRLNLCKAFLNDPEILFLDEPTASLDPDIAWKVRSILLRIHRERNVTMIYTSHNMQEIQKVCERIVFLSRGRVLTQGTPEEILERSGSPSLEDFFISLAHDIPQGPSGQSPPHTGGH